MASQSFPIFPQGKYRTPRGQEGWHHSLSAHSQRPERCLVSLRGVMYIMAGKMERISSGTDGANHPNYRLMKLFELISELRDELPEGRLASVELSHLIRQKDSKGVNCKGTPS